MRTGSLPLWSRYQGQPFLAMLQMGPRIARPRLLDAMAVRTLLVKSFVATAGSSLTPITTHDRWTLYANPDALPRAFTVGRAEAVADGDAALAVLAHPRFDARTTVALTGDATALPSGDPEPLRPATIVVDAPEHVVVDVDVVRPSVLVLTDPFAGGWTATIDGAAAPVREANGLARGVVVPAGRSRVAFRYAAAGLTAGLTAAAVVWSLALGACVVRRRGAR